MHDSIDYTPNFRQLAELTNQASEKELSFFRHIQLLTVSSLAILVVFLQNVDGNLFLRMLFAAAILALSLSILTTGIVIYSLTNVVEKARQKYLSELEEAIASGRKMGNGVFSGNRKILKSFQICSCILLFVSLFLLTLFAVLNVLMY